MQLCTAVESFIANMLKWKAQLKCVYVIMSSLSMSPFLRKVEIDLLSISNVLT